MTMEVEQLQPISRTYQYRKVMKPMLERKRRARINRCLDELKELMVVALQNEGENVAKLEKADILELTVRHLQRLKKDSRLVVKEGTDRWRDGYTQCASQVSKYLASVPGVDISLGKGLMSHLGSRMNQESPLTVRVADDFHSDSSTGCYSMPLTPASSSGSSSPPPSPAPSSTSTLLRIAAAQQSASVWRPW